MFRYYELIIGVFRYHGFITHVISYYKRCNSCDFIQKIPRGVFSGDKKINPKFSRRSTNIKGPCFRALHIRGFCQTLVPSFGTMPMAREVMTFTFSCLMIKTIPRRFAATMTRVSLLTVEGVSSTFMACSVVNLFKIVTYSSEVICLAASSLCARSIAFSSWFGSFSRLNIEIFRRGLIISDDFIAKAPTRRHSSSGL